MRNKRLRGIFGLAVLVLSVLIIGEEIGTVQAKENRKIEENSSKYIYMGGLYASDPVEDIRVTMYRTEDGEFLAAVQHNNEYYSGDFTTTVAKTADGVEYTKMFVDGYQIGYHFKTDKNDVESFIVDEDGTVYVANDISRRIAMDMICS